MAENIYDMIVDLWTKPVITWNRAPKITHEHKHIHIHLGDEEIMPDDPRYNKIILELSNKVIKRIE